MDNSPVPAEASTSWKPNCVGSLAEQVYFVLYCATQSACACQTVNGISVGPANLERYKRREVWTRSVCLDRTEFRRRDAVAVSQDDPDLYINQTPKCIHSAQDRYDHRAKNRVCRTGADLVEFDVYIAEKHQGEPKYRQGLFFTMEVVHVKPPSLTPATSEAPRREEGALPGGGTALEQ